MRTCVFLILALLVVTPIPVYATPVFQKPLDIVRVAIMRDSRELKLAIRGAYRFRGLPSGAVMAQDARLSERRVRLLNRGFLIGLRLYPARGLMIEPSKSSTIFINNHPFRGEVTLIRTPNNRMTVVNAVNIEDYVKGVLYHEVSHHWPLEVLKAQAVATRTYALYSLESPSAAKIYDVTNDIYSQVYGGKDSERYRTDLAADRTRGQVLTWEHQLIPAYFHATCGGFTEEARQLWNLPDIPPLRGVPCSFCQNSPHMYWKKNMRLKDIQIILDSHGFNIHTIKTISVIDRDRSDRIDHLRIIQAQGPDLIIRGKDFRDMIGPNVLKSNNYTIVMRGYYVDFIGKGWGHGVGMCQWGAYGMALQQFTYKQILGYYYPGSVLMNYHELEKADQ